MENQSSTISNNSLIKALPIMVNFNDVRNLIRLLKKRKDGISVTEITDIFLRRLLDPCKIMAYEEWGLIINQNNLIRLSQTGLELATSSDSEAKIYQKILMKIEPYHKALEWIYRQNKTLITYLEVVDFWKECYPKILDPQDEKKDEDSVISFFNLCHHAELGLTTIGRKSHLTRLNIDKDEINKYLIGKSVSYSQNLREIDINQDKSEHFTNGNGFSDKKLPRVFLSVDEFSEILFAIKPLLEISEVQAEVVIRPQSNEYLSLKTCEVMRNCAAAIIIANDQNQTICDGRHRLNDQLLSEICSTFALFKTKVLLIWTGKTCPNLPTEEIEVVCLKGKQITWENGIRIGQIIKKFKNQY